MAFKLPAQQRIKKEEDFKLLLKKGKKIRNRFFFIFFRE
jgi:ribonuclease P protein component